LWRGCEEGSASFLKKRSKKLLFVVGVCAGLGKTKHPGVWTGTVVKSRVKDKSFLLLFFKKEALAFFSNERLPCTPRMGTFPP
jgi:hypothetical protein